MGAPCSGDGGNAEAFATVGVMLLPPSRIWQEDKVEGEDEGLLSAVLLRYARRVALFSAVVGTRRRVIAGVQNLGGRCRYGDAGSSGSSSIPLGYPMGWSLASAFGAGLDSGFGGVWRGDGVK